MPLTSAVLAQLDDCFPVIAGLPPPLRERIAREAQLLAVPAGARLFDERSPCRGFPLLLDGSVRVAKLADSGREIRLYRVEPGQCCILSSSCLLGQADYTATGTAEAAVTLVALPPALFHDLLAAHEGFRRLVFGLLSARLADLMALVEEVAFRRLDQRLARLLLARGPELRATHQALADELGSVREIVSRLLNGFAADRLVELGRERVRITDADGLRRVAGA